MAPIELADVVVVDGRKRALRTLDGDSGRDLANFYEGVLRMRDGSNERNRSTTRTQADAQSQHSSVRASLTVAALLDTV